jgi:hypothetical protein
MQVEDHASRAGTLRIALKQNIKLTKGWAILRREVSPASLLETLQLLAPLGEHRLSIIGI